MSLKKMKKEFVSSLKIKEAMKFNLLRLKIMTQPRGSRHLYSCV